MILNSCAYKWIPGRFVIVDNTVTYHSREPFAGRRVCYAAIAKGTKPVVGIQTHLVLHSGYKMPQVGFGLWKVGTDVAADCVYNAIKAGYRLMDGASCYENELEVGQGMTRALNEKLVERKDLFVVSKLWNTYHRPEHVKPALMRTLKDLNVDYLDLFLIHFPISLKYVDPAERYHPRWFADVQVGKVEIDWSVTFQQTWHAMEELVREGLVRSIGLSNVGTTKLMDVLKYCKIKPAVLQVEMHPYLV
jgi:D-xylose reductase